MRPDDDRSAVTVSRQTQTLSHALVCVFSCQTLVSQGRRSFSYLFLVEKEEGRKEGRRRKEEGRKEGRKKEEGRKEGRRKEEGGRRKEDRADAPPSRQAGLRGCLPLGDIPTARRINRCLHFISRGPILNDICARLFVCLYA